MKTNFMKKTMNYWLFAVAMVILASCGATGVVPVTGRKQRIAVDDQTILALSQQQYQEYMKSAKPSTNATNTAMVKRVGQRIASAVETYLKNNGYANEVQNFKWEFNLVQDRNVNAFCMPGGKIVVYEGLLPVTQDEASLAIVIGHEVAHAVAKHSAEQLTKQQTASTGTQILGGVLQAVGVDAGTASVATAVAGQAANLMNLKYSRGHETEADHMGLIFAAMAGYDPRVAVSFWKRMASSSGGSQPVWLSSHPSDAQRISDIQNKFLPEALKYYNKK